MSPISTIRQTIHHLMQKPKGLLAIDESAATLQKRFAAHNIDNTLENRVHYRHTLLTTPHLEDYVSGIILIDETLDQEIDGKPCATYLNDRGIVPGLKLDQGLIPFNDDGIEQITQGIESLVDRCYAAFKRGVRFAKWRSVHHISNITPTDAQINETALRFICFIEACNVIGLVPIIEPEILASGQHSVEACAQTMAKVWSILRQKLGHVQWTHVVIKTSMVIPGLDNTYEQLSPAEIAEKNIHFIQESLPDQVPLVVYLSGGQSDHQAMHNLNAIAKIAPSAARITFSFGRTLQNEALAAWHSQGVEQAQQTFIRVLQQASLASIGHLPT